MEGTSFIFQMLSLNEMGPCLGLGFWGLLLFYLIHGFISKFFASLFMEEMEEGPCSKVGPYS